MKKINKINKIKKKQKANDDKVKEETFNYKKKKTHWMWYYFPIPTSVLVEGMSTEKTKNFALNDAETMEFIKDKELYEKYCQMVQKVDYATFFNNMGDNEEDDKRKFKESIFHFLHFSIDLVIFHNTRKKITELTDEKLLGIKKSGGFENSDVEKNLYDKVIKLFNNAQYDAKAFIGNESEVGKAIELIKICFDKKNEIEKAENKNLEYINEQWLVLEKQIYNITNKKIKNQKEQLKKLKKKYENTTGDGSCFFWAILQTISKNKEINKQIDKDTVENLRKEVIKAMIKNQEVLIGKNVNPKESNGNIMKVEGGSTILSFSSMAGRENDGKWDKTTSADVAINNNETKKMTWKEYTTHMEKEGVWADHGVVVGMSFYLKRKIYIISSQGFGHNTVTDPINFIKDKKRLMDDDDDDDGKLLKKYEWPKNKPIIIFYQGNMHYEQTQDLQDADYNQKNDNITGEKFLKIMEEAKKNEEEIEFEKPKEFIPNLEKPLITSNKCYGLKKTNDGWCAKLVGPCSIQGGGKSKKIRRKKNRISRRKRIRKQSKRRKKNRKTKKII